MMVNLDREVAGRGAKVETFAFEMETEVVELYAAVVIDGRKTRPSLCFPRFDRFFFAFEKREEFSAAFFSFLFYFFETGRFVSYRRPHYGIRQSPTGKRGGGCVLLSDGAPNIHRVSFFLVFFLQSECYPSKQVNMDFSSINLSFHQRNSSLILPP